MGLLDELKKLTKPYDDDRFLDDELSEPPRKPAAKREAKTYTAYAEPPRPAAPAASRPGGEGAGLPRNGKVVNLATGAPMRLLVVRPERFAEGVEIADHLRGRHAVVLNLESSPKDMAQRLIDFLSGVAYAQDGKIRRIAANMYIVTPSNVEFVSDEPDEFGNQRDKEEFRF